MSQNKKIRQFNIRFEYFLFFASSGDQDFIKHENISKSVLSQFCPALQYFADIDVLSYITSNIMKCTFAVHVVSTGSILVLQTLLFNLADMQLKAVVNPLILKSLPRQPYLSEFSYIVVKITRKHQGIVYC